MKWWKAWRISRVHSYSHSRAHSPTFPSLHLRHNSFSNPFVALPTSQLVLQPFRYFTYVTVHSPILLSLSSYVTSSSLNSPGRAHSPTFPSLYLRHNSFSNPSVALPTSQLILQPFPGTHRHGRLARWRACDVREAKEGLENELWCRWSNGRVGEWSSPMSQLILQPFRRFTYVTAHSPTLLSLLLRHKFFT